MTPEEMNGLLIFGTHVTKNVAVLIFIAIVYGICLCITPVAFTALLRRERTRQTIYQLVIVTFLFCIMSLYTASIGQLVIWQISQTLSHLDEGLSARLMHVDNTSVWNFILETWMQPIQVYFSWQISFVYAILALVDTVNLSPVDWARSFLALFCQLLANLNPILVIIIVRLHLSVIDKTTLHLTTMSEAHSQGANTGHESEDVERQDKAAPWLSGTTGVSAARRGTSSLSEVASARDRVSGEKEDVGEIAGSARDSFNETPEVEAKR
ncbi:uncharacterized protein SCHCODRAFT_02676943 [Schizophyllum commune H4-8]|uniref:Uncharacterized protein n=1 Tax=Schizophyllum commune (strain H4-8 / FGSC 9210) TaxID=578458 RepID=D8Q0T7_SCHCM|nr:uncharacterized protein SCHCODRAFT_02676943 [Schizophyllum commune H4-8]KAI5895140.1 hypothetical protein SCHCODRAFT_02676943 [Schizophyllum commune H4-8]